MLITSTIDLHAYSPLDGASSISMKPPIDSLPSMHLIMHATVKVSSDLMQSETSEYSHWLHFIGEIQQYVDRENHISFCFFHHLCYRHFLCLLHFLQIKRTLWGSKTPYNGEDTCRLTI